MNPVHQSSYLLVDVYLYIWERVPLFLPSRLKFHWNRLCLSFFQGKKNVYQLHTPVILIHWLSPLKLSGLIVLEQKRKFLQVLYLWVLLICLVIHDFSLVTFQIQLAQFNSVETYQISVLLMAWYKLLQPVRILQIIRPVICVLQIPYLLNINYGVFKSNRTLLVKTYLFRK